MRTDGARWMSVALGLAFAGAVVARELPALPQDLPLARASESPGQVTFRHASHVDADRPACVTCHPRLFSVLGRSSPERRAAVAHAAMEQKGEACGACHGKQAFGFEDCSMCHAP
jgi:c(7)-type cytochrome triheme protein